MSIVPALQQQKILIVSGLVIVALIFFGSWYVADQAKVSNTTDSTTTTPGGQQGEVQPTEVLTVRLQPQSVEDGEIAYTLKVAPTSKALQSIGLQLLIEDGTIVQTSQKSFSSSTNLGSQGWQAAGNNKVVTENNRSSLQVGFVNLNPSGFQMTEDLVLGEFTVRPASPGKKPQISIDQAVSTAFAKDGAEMDINVLFEPAVTQ